MSSQDRLGDKRHLNASVREIAAHIRALPDDHPVRVAARAYTLSLSLVIGPAILSLLASPNRLAEGIRRLKGTLKRELSPFGFAFAITVAVSGPLSVQRLLESCVQASEDSGESSKKFSARSAQSAVSSWLSTTSKSFLCNVVFSFLSFVLLRRGRDSRRGHEFTLDLSFILLARALDSLVQNSLRAYLRNKNPNEDDAKHKKRLQSLRTNVDAFVFWASSARIMRCFFYEPERLPRSYNKWIMTLANVDPRILSILRAIRSGTWTYQGKVSTVPDLVSSLSSDLGYPSSWGDPSLIPAFGGPRADAAWQEIGVRGRNGLGGIPCELVHGGVGGNSCVANATLRGSRTFLDAFMLYLPVHFLPALLSQPSTLLIPTRLAELLRSVSRSAAFLSTFVSSIWISICLTRTLFVARLLPFISHDFWDGPLGCTFAGSLVCGASIWVEEGRRRGEISLYVLPRAIRACLPELWLRKRGVVMRRIEMLAYVLSLSTLLTMAMQRPDSLRGLSKWTLAFMLRGTKSGVSTLKPSPPPSEFPPPAPANDNQKHANIE